MCTDVFTVMYKYYLREPRQWMLMNRCMFRVRSFCNSVEMCLSEKQEGDLQYSWKISLFHLAVEQGERAPNSACTEQNM